MMDGREVSLQQMLDAREWRADQQRALLTSHGGPLLCLTLNIAGPVKRFPLADRAFADAKQWISTQLGDQCSWTQERLDDTGHWALYALHSDALTIKRMMCALEDAHPIGRLLDMDIIGADGARIGREAAGYPVRRCLLCGGAAHACARSRAHPIEALQRATIEMLMRHVDDAFVDMIQRAATNSLLQELNATPKPGLVDRANSGAHRDMNYDTFTRSIATISSYFGEVARKSIQIEDPADLFAALKILGLAAEADMMAATGGANAHRGAIFALGLIAAGCGRLHVRGEPMAADRILREVSALGALALTALHQMSPEAARSHGELAYVQSGAGGARAEAARGYPALREIAIPTIRHWLGRGASQNDASVAALLALIGHLEDTNLIARAGPDRARAVRADVRRRVHMANGDLPKLMALAAELDAEWIKSNLSPGGCADLLAAAWMIITIEDNTQHEGAQLHGD